MLLTVIDNCSCGYLNRQPQAIRTILVKCKTRCIYFQVDNRIGGTAVLLFVIPIQNSDRSGACVEPTSKEVGSVTSPIPAAAHWLRPI